MTLTVAIAAPVNVRFGDIVAVFWLDDAADAGGRWGSLRSVFSDRAKAAHSPFVYNETSRAWFITKYHAQYEAGRVPGAARVYPTTPDADLPVARAVRGRVLGSLVANGNGETSDLDSMVTIDVIETHEFLPGDPWLPSSDGV